LLKKKDRSSKELVAGVPAEDGEKYQVTTIGFGRAYGEWAPRRGSL
jgi:hypothetical protein